MKKTLNIGKLKLSRETLGNLNDSELKRADGGLTGGNLTCANTCACTLTHVSACVTCRPISACICP